MFDNIKNILVNEMNLNPELITPDAEMIADLGLNSLELADLIVMCEERFDVTFEDEKLQDLVTIGDVAKYIEEHANS